MARLVPGRPKDVTVLVQISAIYTSPRFRIVLDPWHHFYMGNLSIRDETEFSMVFREHLGVRVSLSNMSTIPDNNMTSLSSSSARQYTYGLLRPGEFRLFVLFRGGKDEPLRGIIFTCSSFKSTGPYRTLSYEWGVGTTTGKTPGTTRSTTTIAVQDGFIQVGASLGSALKELRHEVDSLVLWIDAICINQANESEKAKQIPLLPKIFQQATCTLAFISVPGNHGSIAMMTLLQIAAKKDCGGPDDWPTQLPPIPSSWEALAMPGPDDALWVSVKAFFDSTWFRRVWIIQEAVVSPTVNVVCGGWTARWDYLQQALDIIREGPQLLPQSIASCWAPFLALSNLRAWESRMCRWNLLCLLDTFSYADSTLKRDRFFALLGLASDGHQDEFEPDYKTRSFEEIARRFGRAFVDQGRGMHLLYRAGTTPSPTQSSDRFPSWLPDFTKQQSTRLMTRAQDYGAAYSASNATIPDITWLPGDTLRVAGYRVDKVVRVSRSCNRRDPKQLGAFFREIDAMVDDEYEKEGAQRVTIEVPVAGAKFFGEVSLEDSYAAFRHGLKKWRVQGGGQAGEAVEVARRRILDRGRRDLAG